MKTIILVGAGVAAFLIYKLFHSVSDLKYFVKAVNVRFDGIIPVFEVSAIIDNPTAIDYDVSAFAGSLYFSGIFVGSVGGAKPFTVPKFSQTVFNFSVALPTASIVSDVINKISQGNGINYNIAYDGYIVSKGASIPMSLKWKI